MTEGADNIPRIRASAYNDPVTGNAIFEKYPLLADLGSPFPISISTASIELCTVINKAWLKDILLISGDIVLFFTIFGFFATEMNLFY